MAEYDAFGRRKGEDPLEQLSSGAPPPAQAPAVSTPPPAMPARPKGLGVAVAIALVVVVASIGAAVSLLAGSAEEGILEPVAVEEGPMAPGTSQPAEPAAARGLDEGSLLTRPVLARAIRAMRVAELGRPANFRVAADRIDARLVTANGGHRHVQAGPAGVPRELSFSKGGRVPAMPWSAVDPGAPQRLVRAATEREKRSAHDVDYLTLLDLGKPTWGLFFEDGTHYQGDAAGRIIRRVS